MGDPPPAVVQRRVTRLAVTKPAAAPDAAAPVPAVRDRYQPELQGLRAVAVGLVVAYHVWLGRESGGIDVLFVISGFLITGQLARGHIRLLPMWGRALWRSLPAAVTVLLATMAASIVVLPENQWFRTIREIVAAALYLENWQLAAEDRVSVVQNFWVPSIQGQFTVVWPLLVAPVAALARRRLRECLVAGLLAMFAGSLAYWVLLTAANQPLASYHPLTRAWEFALGGLLALALDAGATPRWLRVCLGWAGIAGLVACGLVLTFPGYFAPWPALCGAAVIAAGTGGHRTGGSRLGADRWLASRPLEYLGNLSYALYLWHWPVLVLYLVARERAHVGPKGGAVVIGVSLALSVATYHLVERPSRFSRIGVPNPWGAYRFAVLLLVPVLVAAGCWHLVSSRMAASYAAAVDDPDHPGALARTPGFRYWGAEDPAVVPPLAALPTDYAPIAADTCVTSARNADLVICTTPVAEPAMRVVVVGDSHMQQFLAALDPIAERRHWQVVSMLKGGCPFSADPDPASSSEPCVRWNADAMREIFVLRPDLVLTNGSRDVRVGLTEHTPPGFAMAWRRLGHAGIPVLAARDNPRYDTSPSECADAHGRAAPQCATPRAELLGPTPPYASFGGLPANVSFLDLSDYLCTAQVCPPVIGNVYVYLDENHLSATYMRTMSPVLQRAIDGALGR
jgi:peptidoglycan/LPS O-acetylase OafA/YrhL